LKTKAEGRADVMTPAATEVSRLIAAPCDKIYRAFVDKDAVATWLPPGEMKGVVHLFEACQGGTIRMSLVYPDNDPAPHGKTTAKADTFHGRFVRLVPGKLVVWATQFESTDPSFAGEMLVSTTLESATPPAGRAEGQAPDKVTRVTIRCEDIPRGVSLADNEAGCRSSLEKLAAFVER
jgi:uncharacterized protein YndB with AHSA1/START domain